MKTYIGTYSIPLLSEVIVKIDAETREIAIEMFMEFLKENDFDISDLNDSCRVRPLDRIRQLIQ